MSKDAPTAIEDRSATRIVGIGASAGGLEALEKFLANAPADSGLAYIVVQHLAPTGKTVLSELLQRVTALGVHEARHGEKIKPNCVYVIPPNTEIRVVGDKLQLAQPAEPRGLRLPIDVLFSSLASARGENAIAVVLSGMGSDGTLGLQAIKGVGGLAAVQLPQSAQFDSMPRSAIATGCADIQDTAEALPNRILAYVGQHQTADLAAADPQNSAADDDALNAIIRLLQKQTRHDFSLYRESTLQRRVDRRQAIHRLGSTADYASFLKDNGHELDLLFHEILIGVTGFFRDPDVWQHLIEVTLPDFLSKQATGSTLRLWCIGCSTGEEAYSLVIAFTEAIKRMPGSFKLQVFASDINPHAIATARRGEYPLSIQSSVSEKRLSQFFTRHDSHYQIKKSIRDCVLFAQHDVILDPPFTKIDLIACRNLLIYFDPQLQQRLLPLLHYSLRPAGLLLLGSAESIGRLSHLFQPTHSRFRIFRRLDHGSGRGPEFLLKSYPPISGTLRKTDVTTSEASGPSLDALQTAADRLILQVYAPAAVVLNRQADIVYISGRTGKYLEPAAGKANWNVHAMAREGLRAPLARALKQAEVEHAPVKLHGLSIANNGNEHRVDVTVQVLHEPASLRGLTLVVFTDVISSGSDPDRKRDKGSKSVPVTPSRHAEEVQALRAESRAYREEAQAAHEELQSTNEELQSANEELTTSKEEMQSMNEELQTINSELQTKLDDLLMAQSDMKNILNSVEIAILFLDKELNVRRFTDRAAGIFSLRDSDLGRPLRELTNSLEYPDLQKDAMETLNTIKPCEKQVQASDQCWFTIRIMPYRRIDEVVDGVVITLVDISVSKRLEQALRGQSE
ncbi:MAG: chemotaxis protein CheB [Wenzhouxiangella sp.]